jgi:hypothetical protein
MKVIYSISKLLKSKQKAFSQQPAIGCLKLQDPNINTKGLKVKTRSSGFEVMVLAILEIVLIPLRSGDHPNLIAL